MALALLGAAFFLGTSAIAAKTVQESKGTVIPNTTAYEDRIPKSNRDEAAPKDPRVGTKIRGGKFVLKQSPVPGAGLGAFVVTPVLPDTVVGHYIGKVVHEEPDIPHANYTIHLNYTDVPTWIDAYDPKTSSWARYINTSCRESDSNCEFVELPNGVVEVRSLRYIEKGEELLVWYGQEFADDICN